MSDMQQLGDIVQIPCDLITRSPYQARRVFPEAYIQELAASIRREGKNLQPILVRTRLGAEQYELVAGECRWRASLLAGFAAINAIVLALGDEDAHRISLTENIKRRDLNPIEEAEGIVSYMTDWGLTQEEAAKVFNISRSKLANRVRLLNLCDEVRDYVLYGELEEGAARALLPLKAFQQIQLARRAISGGWSVRDVEAAVKKVRDDPAPAADPGAGRDVDIARFSQELSEITGTPIKINHKKGGNGEIVITYFSADQLEGLFEGFRKP